MPAHRGVAGNEVADDLAKEATEGGPHCELEEVSDAARWQTGLSHLSRRAPRGGLERLASGPLPMCSQSEDIARRTARASAVWHYGRFRSP